MCTINLKISNITAWDVVELQIASSVNVPWGSCTGQNVTSSPMQSSHWLDFFWAASVQKHLQVPLSEKCLERGRPVSRGGGFPSWFCLFCLCIASDGCQHFLSHTSRHTAINHANSKNHSLSCSNIRGLKRTFETEGFEQIYSHTIFSAKYLSTVSVILHDSQHPF